VAGKSSDISDVLCDHSLSEAVSADKNEVSGFLNEVESKSLRNDVAINFTWPIPVEVCDGRIGKISCIFPPAASYSNFR